MKLPTVRTKGSIWLVVTSIRGRARLLAPLSECSWSSRRECDPAHASRTDPYTFESIELDVLEF
ncbi:hypothetical protein CONPUDRAFT_136589 [Coniophora puteana RWD-64-598 SS2]|uniref:Uncharacterized protein n=1 Tax=Coniophora puteana (strain RWD-64-598) TaxID=741705 RepID=A0A5M3MS62_CONPW|nr:uncharacterized protein CONPUDRAFT_136589 [Coniophora puteana RWD-64-598 SS2]EIW81940.1 hypothetical protein CONPUDRAFT_136589 [Coniophora puteana RWD-64-598 SS2]